MFYTAVKFGKDQQVGNVSDIPVGLLGKMLRNSELVFAIPFLFDMELINVDFPTFDLPHNTTSGTPWLGNSDMV